MNIYLATGDNFYLALFQFCLIVSLDESDSSVKSKRMGTVGNDAKMDLVDNRCH